MVERRFVSQKEDLLFEPVHLYVGAKMKPLWYSFIEMVTMLLTSQPLSSSLPHLELKQ